VNQPVLELGTWVGLQVQRHVAGIATGLPFRLLFPEGGKFTEATDTVGVLD
jgi:hypothetical protein